MLSSSEQDQVLDMLDNDSGVFKQALDTVVNSVEGLSDATLKQLKGATAGVVQSIPFSDQGIGAVATARQLLSGEIGIEDIPQQYEKNVSDALALKQQYISDAPAAAGVGAGVTAAGLAATTGGLSVPAQAGLGVAQGSGITAGQELASGASLPEAVTQASKTGLLVSGLAGAPAAWSGATRAASKANTAVSGRTPTERADRAVASLIKATPKKARALVEREGIAQTFMDEGLMEGPLPNKLQLRSKIVKNIKDATRRRGKQVTEFIDEVSETGSPQVNSASVAQELRNTADDIAARSGEAQAQLIKQLREKADKIAEDGVVPLKKAWERRQAWDNRAFTNDAISKRAGTEEASVTAQAARKIRDAYQRHIVQNTAETAGPEAAETMQFLNQRFGNLKAMETAATEGDFARVPAVFDRLTIGAVLAGARNPVIAGGFFGGRELARTVGPRQLAGGPVSATRPRFIRPLAPAAVNVQSPNIRRPIDRR